MILYYTGGGGVSQNIILLFYLADPATHPSRKEAIHSSKMFSLVKSLALPSFGNGGCFFGFFGGGWRLSKLKVNLHFE